MDEQVVRVEETRLGEGIAWLSWSAIIAGALAAAALSFILASFGAAVGLSVSSSAPTWRDASISLALLSGLFVILAGIASFGFGGYVAGRLRHTAAAMPVDAAETWDGVHGLLVWALAILIGAFIAVGVGTGVTSHVAQGTSQAATTSAAEPVLSYEMDRLLRTARRPPNVDLSAERAEIGRVLLTAGSHRGVLPDDRTFLIAQTGALTSVAPPDAERRVDAAIADSRSALRRARATSTLLAFALGAAALLGLAAAWAAAVVGGRHRDGSALPDWMGGSMRTGWIP